MTRLRAAVIARLRPSAATLDTFGRHETDPARAGAFAPIARGPVFALLALMALGVVWLLWLPWRALRSSR